MLLTKYEKKSDRFLKFKMIFILVITFLVVYGKSEIRIYTPNRGDIDATKTPSIYNYYTRLSLFGLTRISGTSITFQLKSCRNSAVLLSAAEDLMSPDFIEIFLGAHDGKMTYIRRNFGDTDGGFVGDPLDCVSFLPIWMSWTNGRLQVGRSSTIGQNGVVDWTDTSPYTFKGIGVMSAWGSSGEWIFSSSGFLSDSLNGVFFCASAGYKFSNPALIDQSNTTELQCGLWCSRGNDCQAFTYNKQTGNCQTVSNNEYLQPVVDIKQELYLHCWTI